MSNRHSKGCGLASNIAKYLHNHYSLKGKPVVIYNSISAFMDSDEVWIKEKFTKSLGKNWVETFDSIEEKLFEAKDNYSRAKSILSEEEKKFLSKFYKCLTTVKASQYAKDIERRHKANNAVLESKKPSKVTKQLAANMLHIYKEAFPVGLRAQVNEQILSKTFEMIDRLRPKAEAEAGRQLSMDELLARLLQPSENNPEGNILFNNVRNAFKKGLLNFEERAKKELENRDSNLEDKETSYDTSINILRKIVENDEVWSSLMYISKSQLSKALNVKLGMEYFSVEEYDSLEEMELESGKVSNAEETTPERWMLKAEVLSQYLGLSPEIRSVLSSLTVSEKGENTLLGAPRLADIMTTHSKLLHLFSNEVPLNSDEFLSKINTLTGPEFEKLYNKLSDPANTKLKTKFFISYNKPSITYSNYTFKNEIRNGELVRVMYRNSNKQEVNDFLFKSYVSSIYSNKSEEYDSNRLFDNKGKIDISKFDALISLLIKLNPLEITDSNSVEKAALFMGYTKEEIKDLNRDEIIRDFYIYIGELLGLDLRDSINKESFTQFVRDSFSLFTFINTKARKGNPNITKILDGDKKTKEEFKEKILKLFVTKTVDTMGLKVESNYRFNGGSYCSNIVPSYISERINAIKNAALKGKLKEFLEKEYLNCPVYATKTDDGYIIHNDWLKCLYESKSSDINNASSFLYNFVNNLTRGLGSNDVNFEDFVEKDNILYSLAEFCSAMKENSTKCSVPMFVTGDSNASRYFTVNKYNEDEILDKLTDLVFNEIRIQDNYKSFKLSLEKAGFPVPNWVNNLISSKSSYIEGLDLSKVTSKEDVRKSIKSNLDKGFKKYAKKLEECKIANLSPSGAILNIDPKVFNVKDYIEDGKISDNDFIKLIYLNTKFHTIQQLQFTTIDPSFYNGTNDMQKRYKEMLASGLALDMSADPYAHLSNEEKERIEIETGVSVVPGMQRCLYFKDIKKNILTDTGSKFTQFLLKAGAKNLIPHINKYSNTSLTDGQSYRSFSSYRRIMLMNGTWTNNMEEVYNLIMEVRSGNKTLKEVLPRIEELNVVFMPVKPFYFGFEKYNDSIMIPTQHKYSEFPLIPELYPYNKKLKALSDIMDKNMIDLACASSCVKVGLFGEVDLSGDESTYEEVIKNASDNGMIHNLSLEGYRVQNNVPEHINSSRARGTQFIRHGYGNISGSKPKHYSFLEKVIDKTNKLFTIDSNLSLDVSQGLSESNMMQIYSALGSSGFIRSTQDLFNTEFSDNMSLSNALVEERINSGRSDIDSIDAVTVDDEGNFISPLFEGTNGKDNLTSLFSIIKKRIVKQYIKGGSAVQISGLGFEDDLHIQCDSKGNPIYAECAMAFDFDYIDSEGNRVKLNYTDYIDIETGLPLKEVNGNKVPIERGENGEYDIKESLLEKKFPGILDLIAYRIPTEKFYSTLNLKAVRFFPKVAGGVIALPTQYTTIAGFDFDIDKLYYIRREYKFDKSGNLVKYDANKPVLENSQIAVNNLLFDFYQARLEDEDTLVERYTPGGFYTLEDNLSMMFAIREKDKLSDSNISTYSQLRNKSNGFKFSEFDCTDPLTIAHYQVYNSMYDKLIGAAALQSINQRNAALCSVFELKTPIRIGSCVGSSDEASGKDLKKKIINGNDTENLVTEFLAAAVDAVKNAVLEFYGISTDNFGIACIMARIGHTSEDIGLFLNQPVFKRAQEIVDNSDINISYSEALNTALLEFNNNKPVEIEDYSSYLTQDKMTSYIFQGTRDINFIQGQAAAVEAFKQLQAVARELSEIINATKGTSLGSYQNDIGSIISKRQDIESLYNKQASGTSLFNIKVDSTDPNRKYIIEDNHTNTPLNKLLGKVCKSPFGMEEAVYYCVQMAIDKISNNFLFDNSLSNSIYNMAVAISTTGRLNADVYNTIAEDVIIYMAQQNIGFFNPSVRASITLVDDSTVDSGYSNAFYYTNIFPEYFLSIKNSLELNNSELYHPIFDLVKGSINRKYGVGVQSSTTSIVSNTQNVTPYVKEMFKEYILDALTSESPLIRALAQQLICYSFFNRGFNFGKLSILNLVSTESKKALNYLEEYKDIDYLDVFRKMLTLKDFSSYNAKQFVKMFMINNSNLYQFKKSFNRKDSVKLLELVTKDNDNNNIITLSVKDAPKKIISIKDKENKIYKFSPMIELRDSEGNSRYFICDNGSETGDFTETMDTIVYTEVYKPKLKNYSELELSDKTLVEEKDKEFLKSLLSNSEKFIKHLEEANTEEAKQDKKQPIEDETYTEEVIDLETTKTNLSKELESIAKLYIKIVHGNSGNTSTNIFDIITVDSEDLLNTANKLSVLLTEAIQNESNPLSKGVLEQANEKLLSFSKVLFVYENTRLKQIEESENSDKAKEQNSCN